MKISKEEALRGANKRRGLGKFKAAMGDAGRPYHVTEGERKKQHIADQQARGDCIQRGGGFSNSRVINAQSVRRETETEKKDGESYTPGPEGNVYQARVTRADCVRYLKAAEGGRHLCNQRG